MSISQVSSPMSNHLDAVLSADKNPLLTETIDKVKKYLLNHEGWRQRMLSVIGYDTQTIAFEAIYDYAFRGLSCKDPVYYAEKNLKILMNDFLKEMSTFHAENKEPPSDYWNSKMVKLEKLCQEINITNQINKDCNERWKPADNYVPL